MMLWLQEGEPNWADGKLGRYAVADRGDQDELTDDVAHGNVVREANLVANADELAATGNENRSRDPM